MPVARGVPRRCREQHSSWAVIGPPRIRYRWAARFFFLRRNFWCCIIVNLLKEYACLAWWVLSIDVFSIIVVSLLHCLYWGVLFLSVLLSFLYHCGILIIVEYIYRLADSVEVMISTLKTLPIVHVEDDCGSLTLLLVYWLWWGWLSIYCLLLTRISGWGFRKFTIYLD